AQIDEGRGSTGVDAQLRMSRGEPGIGSEIQIAPRAADGDDRPGTEADPAGLPSPQDLSHAHGDPFGPGRAEVRRFAGLAHGQLAGTVETEQPLPGDEVVAWLDRGRVTQLHVDAIGGSFV